MQFSPVVPRDATAEITLPGPPLDAYAALLCGALELYSFPPVTFDFESKRERRNGAKVRPHEAMRGVEKCVGQLMRSPDPGAVRDGLSNVLYWGWAQKPGRQRDRVGVFRDRVQPNDPRLDRFMNFVQSVPRASQSAAEQLRALERLKLPQFSRMSFTTKILMFLDPSCFAVLDLKIAGAAKQCGFPFMQGLKIDSGIRITKANAACYEQPPSVRAFRRLSGTSAAVSPPRLCLATRNRRTRFPSAPAADCGRSNSAAGRHRDRRYESPAADRERTR